MPPERYPPDDPREWLNRARSNLAMAKNHVGGTVLEDLCLKRNRLTRVDTDSQGGQV